MADDSALLSLLGQLATSIDKVANELKTTNETPPTRRPEKSDALKSAKVKFADERSRATQLLKAQNTLYNILNKTLLSYNKGMIGGLAGLMRAELVRRKTNAQEKRDIELLQKEIKLQRKIIAESEGLAKVRAQAKLETLKNRRKVLVATQRLKGTAEAFSIASKALGTMVTTVRETQQQFGVTAGDATKIEFSNLVASVESFSRSIFSLGKTAPVTAKQIKDAQADFQEEFGGVLTSDAARSLAEEATTLGVTTAQLAKARRAFMTTSMGDLNKAKAETDRFVLEFKRKGLTSTDAMKAIAANSDLLARNGTRFAVQLARAAADAKKIGVEISKVDQLADSIVDNFEGFLEAQAELGAMGISFDTSKLGELAITGDTAAFQNELRTQLATIGPQLMNLDRAQQLSLQQMSGMSMAELQRLAGVTEGSGEDTIAVEERNNSLLNNMVNLIQSAVVPGLTIMSALLASIATWTSITALSTKGGLGGMVGILSRVVPMMGVIFGAMVPIFAALGAIIAITAIGYGIYKMMKPGDDVMSRAGYGKRTLLTEQGPIALNNKDNIIAYADDMVSDDGGGVTRYEKGDLNPRNPRKRQNVAKPKYPYWIHKSDRATADSAMSLLKGKDVGFETTFFDPYAEAYAYIDNDTRQIIIGKPFASPSTHTKNPFALDRKPLIHEMMHAYDMDPRYYIKNKPMPFPLTSTEFLFARRSMSNPRFHYPREPKLTADRKRQLQMTEMAGGEDPDYYTGVNWLTEKPMIYRKSINWYSQENNMEAYADAGYQAFNFLSSKEFNDPTYNANERRQKMLEIELKYPGFASIVEDLATNHEVFANSEVAKQFRNKTNNNFYSASVIEKMSDDYRIKHNLEPDLVEFWRQKDKELDKVRKIYRELDPIGIKDPSFDTPGMTLENQRGPGRRVPTPHFHDGGIVGTPNDPKPLPIAAPITELPQYNTNVQTLLGKRPSSRSTTPIATTTKIDFTNIEKNIVELTNRIRNIQINMDGSRTGEGFSTMGQSNTQRVMMDQQLTTSANR